MTNRIKLDADRADTQSKIAALYIPPLTSQPLKQQVAAKQAADVEDQKSLANLTLIGMAKEDFDMAIDKHLDRSVTAYGDWKKVQEGDVERGMQELRQQVTEQIRAQQDRLKSLQQESSEVDKNLKLVAGADTSAALDFRNQLTSTQILLGVESGDATYRIEQLQKFINANF